MPENFENRVSLNRAPDAQNVFNQVWLAHGLREQFPGAVKTDTSLGDLIEEFGHAALYSGIQAPVQGLTQLVDSKLAEQLTFIPPPEEAPFLSSRWHAQQAGSATGMLLPFMATRRTMKECGLSIAARHQSHFLRGGELIARSNKLLVADGAATGFACDFLMQPVSGQEGNFWMARTKHGITGSLTMGSLTAASIRLSKVGGSCAAQLTGLKKATRDIANGGLAGIPAGVLNADTSALLFKGRLATNQERIKSAYTMTFAGAALSGMHKLEGQDASIAQRTVGRIQDGTVKKVGDLGSNWPYIDVAVPIARPTAVDNFLMGTEFTKVELNIRGEKAPYYATTPVPDLPANHPEKHGFYILGDGAKAPLLIRDREIFVEPDSGSAPKSDAFGSFAHAKPSPSQDSGGITIGRIREGSIKLAAHRADGKEGRVIPLGEGAGANFDLGAHFGEVVLNIRGESVPYYRSKVSSETLKIEPNQFYSLCPEGSASAKLIRHSDVFLVPHTGKEGMPTTPLSSRERAYRFNFEYRKAMGIDVSGMRCEPNTECFEPHVEKFEPPKEFEVDNYKHSEVSSPESKPVDPWSFSSLPSAIPDGPHGTLEVGTGFNGRPVRFKSEWGQHMEPESLWLLARQVQELGSESSNFRKVELVIDRQRQTYYQHKIDTHRFYRLSQQGNRLDRDYRVFEEPEPQLVGDHVEPGGLYVTRWRPPVDPPVPENGTVVGKANGVEIMTKDNLGKDLPRETIGSPFRSPWSYDPATTPFEKVSLRVGKTVTDYWRFKSEPHRFYAWDASSNRLVRDHRIYLSPNQSK